MSKSAKTRALIAAALLLGLTAVTTPSASAGGEATCLDLSNVSVKVGNVRWDPDFGERCYLTPVMDLVDDVLDLIRGQFATPMG